MVDAVTPVAVAPPLSPLNGAKHVCNGKIGSASVPRLVSHRLPQSILEVVPAALAATHDVTPVGAAVFDPDAWVVVADDFDLSSPPDATTATMTAATTTTTM